MSFTHAKTFQIFKYLVYSLLAINVYVFFVEEWAAAPHRFVQGIAIADVIEGFAATIDTSAWLLLLLMFELETAVLADHHFTKKVTISLYGLRAVCYGFIVYAFYGYVSKLIYISGISATMRIDDLCSLAGQSWTFAIDLDEYAAITADRCRGFPVADHYFKFPNASAIVDSLGLTEIRRLAWVDVINSGVWLLVVAVLEIDVWLQERSLLLGKALAASRVSKFSLYAMLLLAAIYWGVKGDFVDFWDAFLWLVAFVFIELNIFEWRQESEGPVTA